jgi:hypothetical protein
MVIKQLALLSIPLALINCTQPPQPQFCNTIHHTLDYGPNPTIKNSPNFQDSDPNNDYTDLDASLANRAGEYMITLKVGGQDLEAVADTGSSDLVFNGGPSLCNNCSEDLTGTAPYATTSTSVLIGTPFTAGYGSGTVSGVTYSDSVGLACGDDIPGVPFDLITMNQDKGPGKAPVPNIVGLAYAGLAQGNAPTLLDQLVSQSKGAVGNIFSVTLCGQKGGQITIGSLNPNVPVSGIQYTAITEQSYYQIQSKTLVATGPGTNGSSITIGSFEGAPTILDTGTTINQVPQDVYNKLVQILSNAGTNIPTEFWTANGDPSSPSYMMAVSDSDLALLPTLTLTVPNAKGGEDIQISMSPQNYIKDMGNGNRMFGFQPAKAMPYIWAQPLLESKHVVFDRGDPKKNLPGQIGFAPNNFPGGC